VCSCAPLVTGAKCNLCQPGSGHNNVPTCNACICDAVGSANNSCSVDGQCPCLNPRILGPQCDSCPPGSRPLPDCSPCNCNTFGAINDSCDVNGGCECRSGVVGLLCSSCGATTRQDFPACTGCGCNATGSSGSACTSSGQCICVNARITGLSCNACPAFSSPFPDCLELDGVTIVFEVQGTNVDTTLLLQQLAALLQTPLTMLGSHGQSLSEVSITIYVPLGHNVSEVINLLLQKNNDGQLSLPPYVIGFKIPNSSNVIPINRESSSNSGLSGGAIAGIIIAIIIILVIAVVVAVLLRRKNSGAADTKKLGVDSSSDGL